MKRRRYFVINSTQAKANGLPILPRRDNKSIIARRKDGEHELVATQGTLATMEGDPHPRLHKCLHANTQQHVSMLRNTAEVDGKGGKC